MAGMSVTTGLVSGIDYDTMITQLMQVEANPQTLLKGKLADTEDDAAAYRAVNTKFDALRTAAEALTKAATWTAAKAASSSTSVTATASSGATPGSLTFAVTELAATHTAFSTGAPFAATSSPYGSTSITIADRDADTAPVEVTLPAGATLAEAVAAINAKNAGVTAAAVNTGSGYRLQVTATTSGADGAFDLGSTDPSATTGFVTTTTGRDALLDLGGGITATSASNTFTDLMPGVSLTVSTKGETSTISVASDPQSLATAVQTLVTAANDVLSTISKLTNSTGSASTAVLKGDSSLRRLSSQVLDAVYAAVGGTGTAATAGLQTTRDGTLSFTAETFTKALAADPALVQRLLSGTPATTVDGVSTPAVPGVAQRLATLAQQASNTTTGTLTLLAKSQDDGADDLQTQIDDWDRRLELRKTALTAQFSAMETMLGTLQNQSSWLSSQIGSLPRWSSSDS
jgi:flagellar hook-associated protein 2